MYIYWTIGWVSWYSGYRLGQYVRLLDDKLGQYIRIPEDRLDQYAKWTTDGVSICVYWTIGFFSMYKD